MRACEAGVTDQGIDDCGGLRSVIDKSERTRLKYGSGEPELAGERVTEGFVRLRLCPFRGRHRAGAEIRPGRWRGAVCVQPSALRPFSAAGRGRMNSSRGEDSEGRIMSVIAIMEPALWQHVAAKYTAVDDQPKLDVTRRLPSWMRWRSDAPRPGLPDPPVERWMLTRTSFTP